MSFVLAMVQSTGRTRSNNRAARIRHSESIGPEVLLRFYSLISGGAANLNQCSGLQCDLNHPQSKRHPFVPPQGSQREFGGFPCDGGGSLDLRSTRLDTSYFGAPFPLGHRFFWTLCKIGPQCKNPVSSLKLGLVTRESHPGYERTHRAGVEQDGQMLAFFCRTHPTGWAKPSF